MAAACSYGNVFSAFGTVYVEIDGGAIRLAHAVEREKGAGAGGAFVTLDGKETFIPAKFGADWWEYADMAAVRRIAVY